MEFKLYKIEGYEAAIMALRMSKGKYYSWGKAEEIQQLVHAVTDERGFLIGVHRYQDKLAAMGIAYEDHDRIGTRYKPHNKITGDYSKDIEEFQRLLGLTKNNAMGEFTHHTLMKYIDVTFITEGLHRGAQDDLDAHAIAFNNRITRYSTRLAEITETPLSDFYKDKLIQFSETPFYKDMPDAINDGSGTFEKTPWGYVHEKYATFPAKNGRDRDVQRGGMPIGMESNAIWKIDLASLRYVYHMRSKLSTANPELKIGIEQLADQLETSLPVFGEHFRKVFTDSKQWEHTNKVRTITHEEWEAFKKYQRSLSQN